MEDSYIEMVDITQEAGNEKETSIKVRNMKTVQLVFFHYSFKICKTCLFYFTLYKILSAHYFLLVGL